MLFLDVMIYVSAIAGAITAGIGLKQARSLRAVTIVFGQVLAVSAPFALWVFGVENGLLRLAASLLSLWATYMMVQALNGNTSEDVRWNKARAASLAGSVVGVILLIMLIAPVFNRTGNVSLASSLAATPLADGSDDTEVSSDVDIAALLERIDLLESDFADLQVGHANHEERIAAIEALELETWQASVVGDMAEMVHEAFVAEREMTDAQFAEVRELLDGLTTAEAAEVQVAVEILTGETLVRESDVAGSREFDKGACIPVLSALDGLTGDALHEAASAVSDEMIQSCIEEGDNNLEEHFGALSYLLIDISEQIGYDIVNGGELEDQVELARLLRDNPEQHERAVEILQDARTGATIRAIEGRKQTTFYVDGEQLEVGETVVNRDASQDIVLAEHFEFTISSGETLLDGTVLTEDMTVETETLRRLECGFQIIRDLDDPDPVDPDPVDDPEDPEDPEEPEVVQIFVCRDDELVGPIDPDERLDSDTDTKLSPSGTVVCKDEGNVFDDIENESVTGVGDPQELDDSPCVSDEAPAECDDDGFAEEDDLTDHFTPDEVEIIDLCDATDAIETTYQEVLDNGFLLVGTVCEPIGEFVDEESGNTGEEIIESVSNEGTDDDFVADDHEGNPVVIEDEESSDGRVEGP